MWRSDLTGLDAPAGAEIVLEGFIHPATWRSRDRSVITPVYNAQGDSVLTRTMSLRREAIYQALHGPGAVR